MEFVSTLINGLSLGSKKWTQIRAELDERNAVQQ